VIFKSINLKLVIMTLLNKSLSIVIDTLLKLSLIALVMKTLML